MVKHDFMQIGSYSACQVFLFCFIFARPQARAYSLKAILQISYFAKQNKLCVVLALAQNCISCPRQILVVHADSWASTEPSTPWEILNCGGLALQRDVGHKCLEERGLQAGREYAGLGGGLEISARLNKSSELEVLEPEGS